MCSGQINYRQFGDDHDIFFHSYFKEELSSLYDLENDPHELNNLAADPKYKKILNEHSAALDAWIKESGDYIPSFRTQDDFDRVTGERTPARQRPRPTKMQMYKASGAY